MSSLLERMLLLTMDIIQQELLSRLLEKGLVNQVCGYLGMDLKTYSDVLADLRKPSSWTRNYLNDIGIDWDNVIDCMSDNVPQIIGNYKLAKQILVALFMIHTRGIIPLQPTLHGDGHLSVSKTCAKLVYNPSEMTPLEFETRQQYHQGSYFAMEWSHQEKRALVLLDLDWSECTFKFVLDHHSSFKTPTIAWHDIFMLVPEMAEDAQFLFKYVNYETIANPPFVKPSKKRKR